MKSDTQGQYVFIYFGILSTEERGERGERGEGGGGKGITCGQYLTKVTIILPYPKKATDVVFSERGGVNTLHP